MEGDRMDALGATGAASDDLPRHSIDIGEEGIKINGKRVWASAIRLDLRSSEEPSVAQVELELIGSTLEEVDARLGNCPVFIIHAPGDPPDMKAKRRKFRVLEVFDGKDIPTLNAGRDGGQVAGRTAQPVPGQDAPPNAEPQIPAP